MHPFRAGPVHNKKMVCSPPFHSFWGGGSRKWLTSLITALVLFWVILPPRQTIVPSQLHFLDQRGRYGVVYVEKTGQGKERVWADFTMDGIMYILRICLSKAAPENSTAIIRSTTPVTPISCGSTRRPSNHLLLVLAQQHQFPSIYSSQLSHRAQQYALLWVKNSILFPCINVRTLTTQHILSHSMCKHSPSPSPRVDSPSSPSPGIVHAPLIR